MSGSVLEGNLELLIIIIYRVFIFQLMKGVFDDLIEISVIRIIEARIEET